MSQPRPRMMFFQTGGANSSHAGAGGLGRRLRIAGFVLLALFALGLTLLIVVPLALLMLIVGAVWLIYVKISRALSSLFGGHGRDGRRNVRVIER